MTSTNTSPASQTASATDVVQAPSLSVTETGNGTVNSTDPVRFTIVVSNARGRHGLRRRPERSAAWLADLTSDAGTITGGTLTDNIGSLASQRDHRPRPDAGRLQRHAEQQGHRDADQRPRGQWLGH